MAWSYYCPHCNAHLNPGNDWIALLGLYSDRSGLFYLHPKPGNHTYHTAADLEPSEGDKVKFVCPVCQKSLTFRKDPTYATLQMRDENLKNHAVFFSRISGHKRTVAGELADE